MTRQTCLRFHGQTEEEAVDFISDEHEHLGVLPLESFYQVRRRVPRGHLHGCRINSLELKRCGA